MNEELECSLDQVAAEQMAGYFAWLTNAGKSSSTVTRSLASVKGFYSYLMSAGYVESNPAKAVHLAKVEKKLPQILTGREVELLLEQPQCTDPKGFRDKAMLDTFFFSSTIWPRKYQTQVSGCYF